MSEVVLPTKQCRDCGEEKPLSSFHRNARRSDGHSLYCKPCGTARTKAYQRRKKEEMGEEAWLESQREQMAKHRSTQHGREAALLQGRIQSEAVSRLKELHRDDWERLLSIVRYEMEAQYDSDHS